jgi:ABC-type glutathione transport system ATPase component
MRIAPGIAGAEADLLQHLVNPAPTGGTVEIAVAEGFANELADLHARIQRGIRILEHHLGGEAVLRPIGALALQQWPAAEQDRAARRRRIDEVLEEVGLGASYAGRYAHELSGGQRQRVAIARAVARRPAFVVADEPVSALDMTVRAQVLDLFADLQARHGFACLFISHDLGVVEQVADRIVVMNDGRIVEQGPRDIVLDQPQDAYTRTLLSAIPALEPTSAGGVQLRWRFDAPLDVSNH